MVHNPWTTMFIVQLEVQIRLKVLKKKYSAENVENVWTRWFSEKYVRIDVRDIGKL